MVLPTITRGIGFRDDYLDASITQSNAASVSGVTVANDGDLLTWSGTFTNPTINDLATVYRAAPSVSGSVYGNLLGRLQISALSGGSFGIGIYQHYTDGTTVVGTLLTTSVTSTLLVGASSAQAGKLLDRIGFSVLSRATQGGTFTFTAILDFVLVFKETLTLPSIETPITFTKNRIVVELPILGSEGGVVQDLGSLSPEIMFSGNLVTTGPYTADQWWQILYGLLLEQGNAQADGNPTWQWFQSDQVNAKVIPRTFQARQPMGNVQLWPYNLSLKQFDVVGETVSKNLVGVVY